MRYLFILLFALTTISTTGCALPRAIFLDSRIRHEIPSIPGSVVTEVNVEPWAFPIFYRPSADINYEVNQPRAEVVAWYREKLANAGWELDNDDWDKALQETTSTPLNFYVTRKSWFRVPGTKIFLTDETMSVDIRLAGTNEKPLGTDVTIRLGGTYLWDYPTMAFDFVVVFPLAFLLSPISFILYPALLL